VAEITNEQKIAALRREIALRRNVYKIRIERGKMPKEAAAHEIAVMEAVLADYQGAEHAAPIT
jgi:hypothetical protein